MQPAELARFERTFTALKPRREVYQHPEDKSTELIEKIKSAITSGENNYTKILGFIKSLGRADGTYLKQILDDNEGLLWDYEAGPHRSHNYYLIADQEEDDV